MADAFEDEAEQTVSIHEYLKDVEEQELEADLVLGGDEGNECTYSKGYMKRQAIFSCLTCTPGGNAGVCTACSLSCHDGHEIVELWTKRNFRCDCGNSKFGEFYCKLLADKDTENVENSYNQNFKGSYCTCERPYPDPDAEEQVEMIQCCICEDWFHEDHLGLESSGEIPRNEEGEPLYEDFICKACAVVCSFLTVYPESFWASISQHDAPVNTNKEKNVLGNAPSACASSENIDTGNCSYHSPEMGGIITKDEINTVSVDNGVLLGENSEKNTGLNQCSQNSVLGGKCVIGVDLQVAPLVLEKKKPMFLSKNWRDFLCRCGTCVDFYSQKGIGFLIEREDSIVEYEKMAKQKREEKLQQQEGVELNLLNKMGHVEKMEILSGIADMKNEIQSFLETFDSSKPITSADVHQVFENLAKKRRHVLFKRSFRCAFGTDWKVTGFGFGKAILGMWMQD
ncbi:hypothetical protein HHK36_027527 [Tetracentron sinense]|uniref:UBR-type domain-containing protein n=1 Tax=Tetracentron sinense TaxID=13715 RepID=A0A834YHP1_TETSI|nr:hypothetical protein HHK36_027527 [Tetracentron sinense]